MQQVDVLLEQLEQGAAATEKVRASWKRFVELRAGHGKIPAPVSGHEVFKLRAKIARELEAGNGPEAQRLVQEIGQVQSQNRDLVRRKESLVEAVDAARIEAAQLTREVLRDIVEECGREIARIASSTPHYGIPQLLPERVRELGQRAAWASNLAASSAILYLEARESGPPFSTVLSWIRDIATRRTVGARCSMATRAGAANL